MIMMSSNVIFEYVCVSVFLLLAAKVDSQGIRFPTNDDYRPQGASDCNCITIRRCPVLRNRRDWRIAGVTCGYGNGQYRRVCCPTDRAVDLVRPPVYTVRPSPPVEVTRPPPPVDIPRQPIPETPAENGVCGVSNYEEDPFKPLIMGGENATEGQWPWMAAIRIRETTGYYSPWCSGFLIDRRHILSAAHCYHNRGDDQYRARVGNINQNIADEYRIVRIDVPAGYTSGQFYDDIAVLTLERPVNFPNFNPVCLPNDLVSRMSLTDRGTTVSGWGADRNGGEQQIFLKYLARLPVMSNQECQRKLRQTLRDSFQRQFPRGVSRGFICATFKEGGKDACGGDSGGPQMIQSGNRWYAIGVISFGFRCGIPGMPGGYTRIANYIDWIMEKIRD